MARDKTDVVLLSNGDRVTGEIMKLERGRLRLSTDHMGTVQIEWEEIKSITSHHLFEVELESGEKHFGSIAPASAESNLLVTAQQTKVELRQPEIVKIPPLEGNFWKRLDGYVDVGLSFTRANRVRQLNVGTEVRQRTDTRSVTATSAHFSATSRTWRARLVTCSDFSSTAFWPTAGLPAC